MKVGVIGAGNMGENHVRTYLSLPNLCELVGVFDVDQNKSKQIASNYQIKSFSSIEDLLQQVEAVSITVPTPFHYNVGITCIHHNVHLLMEKPITTTVQEAKALVQKASDQGIILQVGHIELFNPLVQELKKALEKEKIIAIETHRMSPFGGNRKGADVVYELMIHDLYLIHYFIQEEFQEVYTAGKLQAQHPMHARVLATSATGMIAQLTASYKSNKKVRSIEFLTEDAYISADFLGNELTITQSVSQTKGEFPRSMTKSTHTPTFLQPLTLQLTDFLTSVQDISTPTVTGEQGIKALELSSKISDSIKIHS
ncbi:virulence factor [Geomicrobium halophilum]|uniref:Virulence factor n=1 Tax=Geomicrobium halophilum TaxID=549000 RepID=A0A841PMN9_9BACL|nr:Gfo/Idh/MocA family oxidoreductase [Geomicrobium halophilum]MBB6450009.1 virulence factor [Geomicrobium halophilum]